MNDSLLVRLRQYRPREGRDSLEDFITEVFAWTLTNISGADEVVYRTVSNAMDNPLGDKPELDQVTWNTQVSLDGYRLDMLARWEEGLIVFEHKVHSPLGNKQIPCYRATIEAAYPHLESRVVVITANTGQHSSAADACLCWHQIYTALAAHLVGVEEHLERYHLESFLALLRHEGLHPAAPIAHDAIRYYPITRSLPNKLQRALTPLASETWPLAFDHKTRINPRWGRVGIELVRINAPLNWMPGIFVGVVHDGADHLIKHRLRESLKFQVIVSLDRKLHRVYDKMPAYHALLGSLQELTEGSSWEFYHHLEEKRHNLYHPIYLELPLLEVLRGTSTLADQSRAFYDAACKGIELLQRDGRLQDFAQACQEATSDTTPDFTGS